MIRVTPVQVIPGTRSAGTARLTADTNDELETMATLLALHRIQRINEPTPFYALTATQRSRALLLGAKPTTDPVPAVAGGASGTLDAEGDQ
jgi:hypothetical protein